MSNSDPRLIWPAMGCFMPLDLSIMSEAYQDRIFAMAQADGLLPDDQLWQVFGVDNSGWLVALPVQSWDTPPLTG